MEAQLGVDLPDPAERRSLNVRLAGELRANVVGAAVEELTRVDGFAGTKLRIHGVEDVQQDLRGLPCLVGFEPGAVALAGKVVQIPGREPDEQDPGRRNGGEAPRVTSEELRGAIAQRAPARMHGQSLKMALDVQGQLIDRGVALIRLLAQRHEDDAVEIALQAPAQQPLLPENLRRRGVCGRRYAPNGR